MRHTGGTRRVSTLDGGLLVVYDVWHSYFYRAYRIQINMDSLSGRLCPTERVVL